MPSAKRRKAKLWLLVVFLLLAAVAVPYGVSVVFRDIMFGESWHVMNQIMAGLEIYADENDGFFPPEDGIAGLRRILTPDGLGPTALTCSGSKYPPADSIGQVDESNTSYIYIGGHSLSSPPRTIILIEKLAPGQPVAHVGLADGSVVGVNDIGRP
jgi:hypothetical protein